MVEDFSIFFLKCFTFRWAENVWPSRKIKKQRKIVKIREFRNFKIEFLANHWLDFQTENSLKSVNHNGSAEHHYAALQAF